MPNDTDTLAIITSYPAKNGEIASANAISRYSYLLVNSFPKNQNIVVFSEENQKNNIAYQLSENILIVPTYKYNSFNFFSQVLSKVIEFNKIKDYLIQFEFSIFGGKKIIPSFLITLLGLKLLNKNVSITLHQVATNLNELSGHLGLTRNSAKTRFLNLSLNIFYRTVGVLSNKIIVHDELLKKRLSEFVNDKKIEVIPHAIGDESVKNITTKMAINAKREFGFSKKDKVLTVYGYRSWYKGTDWIVKTVKELTDDNPKLNIKLLVAGGISPTLKDTASYKKFDRRLKDTIKKANGSVKVTGFIPEKDVWKVFAASDIIVFPYRTRMSASGAFALTLAYKKKFLISNHFAGGSEIDLSQNTFEMNTLSFKKVLNQAKNIDTQKLTDGSRWVDISRLYLAKIKSVRINWYVNYFFKKAYQLAQN